MTQTSRYNYYEILEISTKAPQHEVSTAYQRVLSTYSGDNPAIYTIFTENEAREWIKLIEEAYQVIGNKVLRSIYDQRLLALNHGHKEDLSLESIVEASKLMFPEARPEKREPTYVKDSAKETEISARQDWSGGDLRSVREYKNISIERLNELTKINPFYLKALEEMKPDFLPAVVFVRGYVVQVCRALGLNEKVVADSYMKKFKDLVGTK